MKYEQLLREKKRVVEIQIESKLELEGQDAAEIYNKILNFHHHSYGHSYQQPVSYHRLTASQSQVRCEVLLHFMKRRSDQTATITI